MQNELLLLSGNEIPFIQAQITIHQPTIDEISFIGEDTFYTGCQYLNFSKQNLSEQDKNHLNDLNDFEVLMTIIKNNDIAVKKYKVCMQLVLLLLFPNYRIDFLPTSIMISRKQNGKQENHLIDKNNFDSFKQILQKMFCLDSFSEDSKKYNPGGPQAKALVQKFKKRHKKLAELKNQGQQKKQISILSRYVSILAVGERKDMNLLLKYTVYQLFDEFRRFRLKEDYDIYIKAKMAGAKDLEEIKNWMDDIHSNIDKEDNFV